MTKKLTKKQEDQLSSMAESIANGLQHADDLGEVPEEGERELALSYQKLEEAEMWLDRALENLGFAIEDDGDEDDRHTEDRDEEEADDEDEEEADDK